MIALAAGPGGVASRVRRPAASPRRVARMRRADASRGCAARMRRPAALVVIHEQVVDRREPSGADGAVMLRWLTSRGSPHGTPAATGDLGLSGPGSLRRWRDPDAARDRADRRRLSAGVRSGRQSDVTVSVNNASGNHG
jgi:hypothetical protein